MTKLIFHLQSLVKNYSNNKRTPFIATPWLRRGSHVNYAGRLQSTCTSIAPHMRVRANLKLSKDSNGFTCQPFIRIKTCSMLNSMVFI